MRKELVSIPWTSNPWVLSECHCLMPNYFVSNILSVCAVRTQLQHSILTQEFWVARCVSSFVDISSLLRLAGRNPHNPTLTYCIPWGGAWQDFKGRNIWCLPVSCVMRAMVISKKMKYISYISIAFKLHTHLSVQVQLGNSISVHVEFQSTEHTTLRSHSLSAQQTHHWYDTSPQLRQTLRPIHPKNHHHYSRHPK